MNKPNGLVLGIIVGIFLTWACAPDGPGAMLPDANAQSTDSVRCSKWEISGIEIPGGTAYFSIDSFETNSIVTEVFQNPDP